MYKYYKVKAGSARSINAYLCSWKLNLFASDCYYNINVSIAHVFASANKLNRSASLKS